MATDAATAPLLTIAIPTYHRAETLALLLTTLEEQVAAYPQVEVLVSDNASPDHTPEVVEQFRQRYAERGVTLRGQRHAENIGADGNFASVYAGARGKYLWVCGDDDLIVPGGLALVMPHLTGPEEVDLIYASSYGFRNDPVAERETDPMGRTFHTFRSAKIFARVVNIMFTFISGIIVNRERLESLPHLSPQEFVGTNLVQLSWSLPLLLHHRRSVALWQRPVAARQGHAHGYSLGKVFGDNLSANVTRLLAGRPDLVAAILDPTLRRWFPSILIDLRSSRNDSMKLDEVQQHLGRVYGGNFRYWLFTWPVLAMPLAPAKLWQKAGAAVSKAVYVLTVPGFWRKES